MSAHERWNGQQQKPRNRVEGRIGKKAADERFEGKIPRRVSRSQVDRSVHESMLVEPNLGGLTADPYELAGGYGTSDHRETRPAGCSFVEVQRLMESGRAHERGG
ncbi:MAG: hypothetical protein AMXMBFR58_13730 [Phycisphaerae bacterium]